MKPYIKGLYNKLDVITKQINDYQSKCKHINVNVEHHGNTGNYDPSNNIY